MDRMEIFLCERIREIFLSFTLCCCVSLFLPSSTQRRAITINNHFHYSHCELWTLNIVLNILPMFSSRSRRLLHCYIIVISWAWLLMGNLLHAHTYISAGRKFDSISFGGGKFHDDVWGKIEFILCVWWMKRENENGEKISAYLKNRSYILEAVNGKTWKTFNLERMSIEIGSCEWTSKSKSSFVPSKMMFFPLSHPQTFPSLFFRMFHVSVKEESKRSCDLLMYVSHAIVTEGFEMIWHFWGVNEWNVKCLPLIRSIWQFLGFIFIFGNLNWFCVAIASCCLLACEFNAQEIEFLAPTSKQSKNNFSLVPNQTKISLRFCSRQAP